jgi:hypothetical protein
MKGSGAPRAAGSADLPVRKKNGCPESGDRRRPTDGRAGARRVGTRERVAEFTARAFISGLFVLLATRVGAEFVKTGHLTGLLLLVSELLVVVLTVVRRPAAVVDRTLVTRMVSGISIVGVYFIRPMGEALLADIVTACISGAGCW